MARTPTFTIQRLESIPCNGREWYRPAGKPGTMTLERFFHYIKDMLDEEPFILGRDKMPYDIKDIRWNLEKSYDLVAVSLDEEGYATYFGLNVNP